MYQSRVPFFILLFFLLACSVQHNNPDGGRLKVVGEKITMSECEVTVGEWLRYINKRVQLEGQKAIVALMPDKELLTLKLWQFMEGEVSRFPVPVEKLSRFKCKTKKEDGHFYDINPCAWAYRPVTGISYEQAVEFCRWKTTHDHLNGFEYRLPSLAFWKTAAKASIANPMASIPDSTCKDTCIAFNYKNSKVWPKGIDLVGWFFPGKTGLYDLFGNVAEMTLEKGLAVGGHAGLYAAQCHIDSIQRYSKPESWLGFRYIAISP